MSNTILNTTITFPSAPAKKLNLISSYEEGKIYENSDVLSAAATVDAIKSGSAEPMDDIATKSWVVGNFIPTSDADNFLKLENGKITTTILPKTTGVIPSIGSATDRWDVVHATNFACPYFNTGGVLPLSSMIRGLRIDKNGIVTFNGGSYAPYFQFSYGGTPVATIGYHTSTQSVEIDKRLIPSANNTLDLGANSFSWRTIVTNDVTLPVNKSWSDGRLEDSNNMESLLYYTKEVARRIESLEYALDAPAKTEGVENNTWKTRIASFETQQFAGIATGELYAEYSFGPVTVLIYGYSSTQYHLKVRLTNKSGILNVRSLSVAYSGILTSTNETFGAQETILPYPQFSGDSLPAILQLACLTSEGPVQLNINVANARAGGSPIKNGYIVMEGTYKNNPSYEDKDVLYQVDIVDPDA